MISISKVIAASISLFVFSTAFVMPADSYTQTTTSCGDRRQRYPSYPPC